MRNLRRWWGPALVGWLLAGAAAAQTLTDRPAEIPFEPAQSVETDMEGIREELVRFPSAFNSGDARNDIVSVRILRPQSATEPVPVMIILHYWGASDEKIERALAADLNRRGVAAALMALPYHLSRTPQGARSGDQAILPDPDRLRKTMIQSVLDVRRTVDYLQSRADFDPDRIGITGVSLGSIVAALGYAIEPRLQVAGFLLGGADLAHILWNSSRVVKIREALRSQGYTEERLRAELAEVEPLNYLARRTDARAFVIGGRFDTVVPAGDTQKLIEALPGAKSLWIDTGHYGGVFIQRGIIREMSAFAQAEFEGRDYTPPSRIIAPTVRIAAELSFESPLQVGIGIDLISTSRRDAFVTFLATPRGPKLFGGFRVDRNVSVGVFGSSRRASFGVMWSTVL